RQAPRSPGAESLPPGLEAPPLKTPPRAGALSPTSAASASQAAPRRRRPGPVVLTPAPPCGRRLRIGHGAAAAVASALHAAAWPGPTPLRVLLRAGGEWGRRLRRLQPLCHRRRAALEHQLLAGQPGGPRAAACHHQGVTLSFQEDRASLTLSGGPSTLVFDLSKVPGIEAAPRLQALTLGLAERVCSLEQQLAAVEKTAASPRKSPQPAGSQLFLPDPDPQRGGPGPGVRKRCPGESLINPGFKSKKPAGGVDFDET
uniref:PAXX non-homologous end joining factor n=1 Tax=Urocitellus parryii TaxID=9999 RepID=A0A8D2H7B9_UROPR